MIVVSASTGRSSRPANSSRNRASRIPRLGTGRLGEAVEELARPKGPAPASTQTSASSIRPGWSPRSTGCRPGSPSGRGSRTSVVAVRRNCAASSSSRPLSSESASPSRSSTGSIRPTPKKRAQTRLTTALAKYGLSGEVTHSARISRCAGAGPPCRGGTVEVRRLRRPFRPGDGQLPARRRHRGPGACTTHFHSRRRHFREKGGEAPELLALPRRERVIVALGAFQADAQENARHAGREILGLVLLGRVIAPRATDRARRGSTGDESMLGVFSLAVRISRTIRS